MKNRLLFLFLIVLSMSALAEARQVGYRDGDGQWHVTDDDKWPQDNKKAALATEGAITILRPASGSTFEITYLDVVNDTKVGFDDPYMGLVRRTTLETVLSYIDSVILDTGSCQIEIQVSETDGSGALSAAGPFYFTDGSFNDSLAQIHLTTGSDPSPSVPDAQLTVDFGYTWNSTTEAPSSSQYDLYSVLLHELTHCLGSITLTGSDGSSLVYDGVYSSYDNYLYTGGGVKLWNASGEFNGPVSILTGSDGGVVFRGPSTSAIYGSYPRIYAPSTWNSGSSIGHWDEGLSPVPVMTYAIGKGTTNRTYQPFEIKMLEDLGYTVDAAGPEAEVYQDSNPVADGAGPFDLGTTTLGSAALSLTFTLENIGDQVLTTSNLTVPEGFIVSDGLSSSIAAGASDTFTIELPATTAGQFTGTVSFATNDSNENPYNFTIQGTITVPTAKVLDGTTELTDSSPAVDFGLALKGAISPTKTFTVQNTGTAALTTSNLTVPAGYSVTEPLSASIAAGGSDTFTVALGTTQVGTFSGSVSFTTNDADHNPCTFSITGSVVKPVAVVKDGATELTASSSAVDFGLALKGAASPTKTFTVQNTGTAALTTSNLTVPAGYSVTEPLSASIAAEGSDTFTVVLATTQTGTFSGSVSFTTNDTDHNPCTFSITGQVGEPVTVISVGASALPGDGTPVDFGKAEQNSTGPTQTFTVRNDGAYALETSGLTVPAGYSVIEPLASSIAPGASDTFTVQLATDQLGTFEGAVSFDTNDTVNDPVSFNVTGMVVKFLSADPGWLDPSL